MYETPPDDFELEVGIHTLSAWSDISPGTDIGVFRWAFLLIGICTLIASLIAVVRERRDRKQGKPYSHATLYTKPVTISGQTIIMPFSTINSPVAAPPAPPVTGPMGTTWKCETCGKENDGSWKFCIGWGKTRPTG